MQAQNLRTAYLWGECGEFRQSWDVAVTIAGVYLAPEGVVFGADSTASVSGDQGFHFFDFNQKVFEVGEHSSLGLVTWGLGNFDGVSYRTLIAELADALANKAPTSVLDVATRWVNHAWASYVRLPGYARSVALGAKTPHLAGAAPNPSMRTQDEEKELLGLHQSLTVGFCLAGYVLPSRRPEAYSMVFTPISTPPTLTPMQLGGMSWWGAPNFFSRMLFGIDGTLQQSILGSGKWSGTHDDLAKLVASHHAVPTVALPIRDAIDFVHTCIHCTIKAIKFSGLPQVCGGPIELAVITSDRKFRWVKHKPWDAAIFQGDT